MSVTLSQQAQSSQFHLFKIVFDVLRRLSKSSLAALTCVTLEMLH